MIAKAPYDAVAQVVQSQWSTIGIDVKLSALDQQIWTNKVYTQRDFDASVISLTGRTNPVLGVDRSFVCNEGNVPFANPTGYCNPEFDKVALDASAAPLAEQKAHYKKYAEIIARDLNQLALTNSQGLRSGEHGPERARRAVQLFVQHPPELGGSLAAGRQAVSPSGSSCARAARSGCTAFRYRRKHRLAYRRHFHDAAPLGRHCRRFRQACRRRAMLSSAISGNGATRAQILPVHPEADGDRRAARGQFGGATSCRHRSRDCRDPRRSRARACCEELEQSPSARRSSSRTASRSNRKSLFGSSAIRAALIVARPQLHGPRQFHRLDPALPVTTVQAAAGRQGRPRGTVGIGSDFGDELDSGRTVEGRHDGQRVPRRGRRLYPLAR